MAEERPQLSARLDEVMARLGRLEARVARIEERPSETFGRTGRQPGAEDLPVPALPVPQGALGLVGRTLVVLAGAYLVRALTDGHVLAPGPGMGLGLAYAALWQWRADREALSGRRESAAFHDGASSLIAFPLIWETTARFGLLSPPLAYAVLVTFFALGLAVAWHRRLVVNAIVTTVLALATATALLVSTHDLVAALVASLAIAGALELLAFRASWPGLRWTAAVVVNGVAFLLAAVVTRPTLADRYVTTDTPTAVGVLLAVPVLYMASAAARTLLQGRAVTAFDVVQGAAAVLLGFGGACHVLSSRGGSAGLPAALALLLGAVCYGAAFAFVERRPGLGRSFTYYSSAGGLLTLGGTSVLGLGAALSLIWGALGVFSVLLARRFDRMTLRVHGALYLTAAAGHAGLIVGCASALGGRATAGLPPLAWTAALAACGGWLVLATDPRAPGSGIARAPQLLLALLALLSLGKALQVGLWVVLAGSLTRDDGTAAVVRTAVLASLALGLAWTARRGTMPELRWLVYPVVAFGGLKLLMQDLREGRPATLVASLALYGLVLMLAPRLLRRRERRSA